MRDAGAGSCLFRINACGRKGEHCKCFDQTVFLQGATVDESEFVGMLSGVVTFVEAFDTFMPRPSLFMLEGDSKVVIQQVRSALEDGLDFVELEDSPSLNGILSEII